MTDPDITAIQAKLDLLLAEVRTIRDHHDHLLQDATTKWFQARASLASIDERIDALRADVRRVQTEHGYMARQIATMQREVIQLKERGQ